jgi:hypothetical protein
LELKSQHVVRLVFISCLHVEHGAFEIKIEQDTKLQVQAMLMQYNKLLKNEMEYDDCSVLPCLFPCITTIPFLALESPMQITKKEFFGEQSSSAAEWYLLVELVVDVGKVSRDWFPSNPIQSYWNYDRREHFKSRQS